MHETKQYVHLLPLRSYEIKKNVSEKVTNKIQSPMRLDGDIVKGIW